MPHIKKGSLCISIDKEDNFCIAGINRVIVADNLRRLFQLYDSAKNSEYYGKYRRDEVNLLADASLVFWHEEE